MYTEWTRHLPDPKAKEEFQKDIFGAKPILNHLKHILTQKEEALERAQLEHSQFAQPNWAHHQAFNLGSKAVLKYLIKLIDLDQQKEIQ